MSRDFLDQTYVVRVYRCDASGRGQVIGVVEAVGCGEQRAFTNVDELWEILIAVQRGGQTHAKRKSSTRT
jgi:hypothetical protein